MLLLSIFTQLLHCIAILCRFYGLAGNRKVERSLQRVGRKKLQIVPQQSNGASLGANTITKKQIPWCSAISVKYGRIFNALKRKMMTLLGYDAVRNVENYQNICLQYVTK